jgi:dTMP kinase
MEAEPIEFHRHVRQGFLTLAALDPTRYLVVDARQTIDEIAAEIRTRVDAELGARA